MLANVTILCSIFVTKFIQNLKYINCKQRHYITNQWSSQSFDINFFREIPGKNLQNQNGLDFMTVLFYSSEIHLIHYWQNLIEENLKIILDWRHYKNFKLKIGNIMWKKHQTSGRIFINFLRKITKLNICMWSNMKIWKVIWLKLWKM